MSWIIIALTSYFFSALSTVIDKFILGSRQISSPPVYSFYIGLLGFGALIFVPFGFYFPSIFQIAVSLVSGSIFTFGILYLYFAIQKSEASRVAPVIGAITPIVAFILSFFIYKETLGIIEIIGLCLLIGGGLLISFDLPLRLNKKKFFSGFYYSLLSGLFLGVAYLLFKFVYSGQTFFNGFIWTRFGSGLAIAGFFLVPSWRKSILNSLSNFRNPSRSEYKAGSLVVFNKIIGGTSSILFNYALSLGSVTLVNALISSQYVFVLLMATAAGVYFPKVFSEKLTFSDWFQKIVAIAIVALGILLITNSTGFYPLP